MKKKHKKAVVNAIISTLADRVEQGNVDSDSETAYMLSLDDCYGIISKHIHPHLKGWKKYMELSKRDWSTLSEDDVLFMDNVFVEEDWDIFYECNMKAERKIVKQLRALL